MIELHDIDIAFILIDSVAIFMILGMIWHTTPYRRRKLPMDKLFFWLELCSLSAAISDILTYFLEIKMLNQNFLPFINIKTIAVINLLFNAGSFFIVPLFLLYACALLGNKDRLIRLIKIPILLIPGVQVFFMSAPSFFPRVFQHLPMNNFKFFTIFNYIFAIIILIITFFIDQKLLIYYLVTWGMWFLLTMILPLTEFTAIIYAQLLVFSHIIVMNRELEEKNNRQIT